MDTITAAAPTTAPVPQPAGTSAEADPAAPVARVLGYWAEAAATCPVPLAAAFAALPGRSAGTAAQCGPCPRTSGAPLVERLCQDELVLAFYLGGVALPEADVLTLDAYEDLVRASLARPGLEAVRRLFVHLPALGFDFARPGDWPDADRARAATVLARDALSLVGAAAMRNFHAQGRPSRIAAPTIATWALDRLDETA